MATAGTTGSSTIPISFLPNVATGTMPMTVSQPMASSAPPSYWQQPTGQQSPLTNDMNQMLASIAQRARESTAALQQKLQSSFPLMFAGSGQTGTTPISWTPPSVYRAPTIPWPTMPQLVLPTATVKKQLESNPPQQQPDEYMKWAIVKPTETTGEKTASLEWQQIPEWSSVDDKGNVVWDKNWQKEYMDKYWVGY